MTHIKQGRPGTLRHFFETVYLPQRMIDTHPWSQQRTRWAIDRLAEQYGHDIKLKELTDQLAAEHFAWLRAKGRSAATVNNGHRATIFAVWRHAVELGRVKQSPRVRKLKEQRHEPDSWTSDELQRLLEATSIMSRYRQYYIPMLLDDWWRGFILVGYWTGLRAGSLRQIKLEHVDVEERWLYVEPHATKTRRGKRFRFGQDAADAIRKIAEPPRELLFPFPYRREALWKQFRRIQAAAGLADNGRSMSRLHKLRRSVATQAAVRGGMPAAMALLDHSSSEVTKRYLDPSRMPGTDATEFLPSLDDE